MPIKIIAAVSSNGIIGQGNKLPWSKMKEDLRRFRKTTLHHTVVMGRQTFDSLPAGPLSERKNVVLTRSDTSSSSEGGIERISDFGEIITRAKREDIFVIGGEQIYRLAFPVAEELYLTRVHARVEGDKFFPTFPRWSGHEWSQTVLDFHPADEENQYPYTFEVWTRKPDRYIYMPNVRTVEQMEAMQEIRETGVCPFCLEHRGRWHKKPDIWSGVHWVVSENMWPYSWTKEGGVHLVLFLKTHAETEIPPGAWEELGTVLSEMSSRFSIPGGGLYVRLGDPKWTGATVRHIHGHIVQKKDPSDVGTLYL